MSAQRIHIVSFDVPYPADYGGVIDIYFTCRALTRLGAEVVLHCFQYGRPARRELLDIASEVHYYDRPRGKGILSRHMPYITGSRAHPDLLARLQQDQAPILFEGLHTTAFLGHPLLAGRRQVVRMHNIEHDYYRELAGQESHPGKKIFYLLESRRLREYESILRKADAIAAISEGDARSLHWRFGERVVEVPGFHPYHEVSGPLGTGAYAFYHANLSVIENHRAALWLVNEIFRDLDYPLVLAGRAPRKELLRAVRSYPWIRVIGDPEQEEMDTLLRDAQMVVLPTFQATGLKLKLLSSLFKGRHVIANPEMVKGTGLGSLCAVGDTPEAFRRLVLEVQSTPFTRAIREERQGLLIPRFDNDSNGRKLLDLFMG